MRTEAPTARGGALLLVTTELPALVRLVRLTVLERIVFERTVFERRVELVREGMV